MLRRSPAEHLVSASTSTRDCFERVESLAPQPVYTSAGLLPHSAEARPSLSQKGNPDYTGPLGVPARQLSLANAGLPARPFARLDLENDGSTKQTAPQTIPTQRLSAQASILLRCQ